MAKQQICSGYAVCSWEIGMPERNVTTQLSPNNCLYFNFFIMLFRRISTYKKELYMAITTTTLKKRVTKLISPVCLVYLCSFGSIWFQYFQRLYICNFCLAFHTVAKKRVSLSGGKHLHIQNNKVGRGK